LQLCSAEKTELQCGLDPLNHANTKAVLGCDLVDGELASLQSPGRRDAPGLLRDCVSIDGPTAL
jgi:hypothetical protein